VVAGAQHVRAAAADDDDDESAVLPAAHMLLPGPAALADLQQQWQSAHKHLEVISTLKVECCLLRGRHALSVTNNLLTQMPGALTAPHTQLWSSAALANMLLKIERSLSGSTCVIHADLARHATSA
jgi:hypothetical protein